MSPRISAFIICCNEEKKIRTALQSVSFCDEIIVVDSGSTDATLTIAAEFTQKIIVRPWPGHVEQKRFALSQCQYEWVLNIDADEVITAPLQEAIKAIVASNPEEQGFVLSRVVFFHGRFLNKGGWYPEYRLRLMRRTATTWGGEDPHEHAIVQGNIARINDQRALAVIEHYTYDNFFDQLRTINNFSTQMAYSMQKKGKRFSFFALVTRPIARFLKFYFLKRGFLHGFDGFIIAVLEAVYVFLKYAKLRELYHTKT